jgi:hypothetical protein
MKLPKELEKQAKDYPQSPWVKYKCPVCGMGRGSKIHKGNNCARKNFDALHAG